MKLIDKDKVAAEIDKLKGKVWDGSSYCTGWHHALRMLEIELNTIETKEVELEKELERLDNILFDLDGVAIAGATHYLTVEDVKDIAKRFYEMGLNVRKEE